MERLDLFQLITTKLKVADKKSFVFFLQENLFLIELFYIRN